MGELHLPLQKIENDHLENLRLDVARLWVPYTYAIVKAAELAMDEGRCETVKHDSGVLRKNLPFVRHLNSLMQRSPALQSGEKENQNSKPAEELVTTNTIEFGEIKHPVSHTIHFKSTEEGVKLNKFSAEYRYETIDTSLLSVNALFNEENEAQEYLLNVYASIGIIENILGTHTTIEEYYNKFLNPPNQLGDQRQLQRMILNFNFTGKYPVSVRLYTYDPYKYENLSEFKTTMPFTPDKSAFITSQGVGNMSAEYYLSVLGSSMQLMPLVKSNES